jgi:hypothetical protein
MVVVYASASREWCMSDSKEAQMLHPALARAVATAHIEDLQRAAARRYAIRAARRVAREAHTAATSNPPQRPASTLLGGLRAPGPRPDTNRDPSSSPVVMPIGPPRPVGAEGRDRLGIE